jgi:hypothetical protein
MLVSVAVLAGLVCRRTACTNAEKYWPRQSAPLRLTDQQRDRLGDACDFSTSSREIFDNERQKQQQMAVVTSTGVASSLCS